MELSSKSKYGFMSKVEPKLLISIKHLFVFYYQNENEIIFTTDQDEVYGWGCNKSGRLGFGHTSPVIEPAKITELCGINILKISAGDSFMVALTANNDIYAWGFSYGGQMGNGSKDNVCTIPFKVIITDDIKVVDIKCTGSATNLLTQSGHLYWFGYYSDGNAISLINLTPTKFNGCEDIEFIRLSCGYKHTLALTVTGQLYAFGSNKHGQLGIDNVAAVESLTLCKSIEDKYIKKVSCAEDHSIVLTSDGNIYSCGRNNCGQLGIGSVNNQTKYNLISFMKAFIDIFAFQNISMALCANNFIYIWGSVNGKNILRPKRTEFKSFQETIDYCFKPTFSYNPLTNKELFEPMNPIIKLMTKAFNSEKYSDLRFKIEDKIIFVHKWILTEKCIHFETMFSNDWSETQSKEKDFTGKPRNGSEMQSKEMDVNKHPEKKSHEIHINEHTYAGYYAFLRCIYTDIIDTINVEALIDFLDITNEYMEEELKLKCANYLKHLIDLNNACALYSAALRFNSIELEVYCFEYISEQIDEIMETQGFKQMDGIYATKLLTEYLKEKKELKSVQKSFGLNG